jgi:hypothetical protein
VREKAKEKKNINHHIALQQIHERDQKKNNQHLKNNVYELKINYVISIASHALNF